MKKAIILGITLMLMTAALVAGCGNTAPTEPAEEPETEEVKEEETKEGTTEAGDTETTDGADSEKEGE